MRSILLRRMLQSWPRWLRALHFSETDRIFGWSYGTTVHSLTMEVPIPESCGFESFLALGAASKALNLRTLNFSSQIRPQKSVFVVFPFFLKLLCATWSATGSAAG